MIGWVSDGGSYRVLLISGRRVDFTVLGQDVSLFRGRDSYHLRIPHCLRYVQGGEIEHQRRHILKEEASGKTAEICYSMYDEGYDRFRKYAWRGNIITIGSGIEDDFYLQDELLAPHQFVLEREEMRVSELGEKAMGELDGKAIAFSSFHNGSRLRVLNLQLVIHESFIMVNSVENLYVSLPKYHQKEEILPECDALVPVTRAWRNADLSLRYEEVLEDPLPFEERERNPLVFMMGPALTMSSASMMTGMIAAYNGWLNGREWIELLPSILLPFVMVLSTLLWNPLQRFYEKRKEKKKTRRRIQEYDQYLQLLEEDILSFEDRTAETYEFLFPELAIDETAVYRCLPAHADFLTVRIGKGMTRFDLRLSMNARIKRQDPLYEKIEAVKEHCREKELPVLLAIRNFRHIGIRAEEGMENCLLDGLFQLLSYHGPDVMRLVILAEKEWIDSHAWVREIPHTRCRTELRMIVSTMNEAAEAAILLHGETAEIIILSLKPALLQAFEEIPHRTISLTDGPIPNDADARLFLSHAESRLEGNGVQYFTPITPADTDPWEFTSELSRYYLDSGKKSISMSPTFYHLYQADHASGIPILGFWGKNVSREGIKALIGTGDDGDPVILDLHEKGNGPHGLIAGMTGSGKSELIITLLLSLAVNYSPRELQFVMIDFKGGGAAQLFSNSSYSIPHVCGVLSNLDITGMERALVSFRNECHRRELLFKQMSEETGQPVMNLSSYQRSHKPEMNLPYLSALLIIVDEFAELKKDRPDFMRDLISVARVGRSLGMHMILATQKPSGIVDEQIWSNSRFKICLKVQEKQDSMEMIHVPDASWIRRPGEFFLLCDGILTHGYGGYANASADVKDEMVERLDAMAHTVSEISFETHGSSTQAGVVIDEILEYGEGYQPQLLWCSPITEIHRRDLPEEAGIWIGKADDYYHHDQPPVLFSESAMAVFSIDRGAKAEFLNTLLYGLIETCGKTDEIFLLDDLSAADPRIISCRNIIGVFPSSEPEKTDNLLKHLEERTGKEENMVNLILTDVPSFYEAGDDNRPRLHSLIEQADKRRLRLFLFLTSASSVSFRDLSLIPFRLALKNGNVQDLSGIFEMPVHKTVTEKGKALIHREKILEVTLLSISTEELLNRMEEVNRNDGTEKPYELPYLPETVSLQSYAGDGIGLGISIQDYSWVDIRKDQKLLVLATYEEELSLYFEVMKQACEKTVMVTDGQSVEDMDAQIYFMKEDLYISSGAKKACSAVLYIGSGFRDQYRFTTSYKGEFHANYGVFYEKGKNRVIQYAEQF